MKTIARMAVLGLAAFSAGCGDPAAIAVTQEDVAQLRTDVDDLEEALAKVRNDLASERRRGAERIRRLGQVAQAPAVSRSPAADERVAATDASGDAEPEAGSITATQFTEFLSTETGQEVFTAAMRSYQRKQTDDRERRNVEALVAPFAKKAGLSEMQKERMADILLDVSQKTRDAWASMRDVPPEQRGSQVAANIQRSREIREEADAAVGELLSGAQLAIFEEESSMLFGMPQRPPRGDGDGSGNNAR
jgi:hypothetical protein